VWSVWFAEDAGIAAGIVALMDSTKYCAAHAVDVMAGVRLRRRLVGRNLIPIPFIVDRHPVHLDDAARR
jgi:hypothetical protein